MDAVRPKFPVCLRAAAGAVAVGVFMTAAALVPYGEAAATRANDPLLTKLMVDQLEWHDTRDEPAYVLDGEAWIGYDLNKLWLKTDVEHVFSGADDGTEEGELQVLYSRAVSAFWDFQIGARTDFGGGPNRSWVVLGFQGLAPYFFEAEAAVFIGEAGQAAFRLDAEYDLLLTQQWILSPEIEMEFHTRNDAATGTGAGFSEVEAGLRLRYEFAPEFAPYLGVNWRRLYDKTADYARAGGEDTGDTHIVLGVRFWF